MWPQVAIDVGNDGSFEIPDFQSDGTVRLSVASIGPESLSVRIVILAALVTPGSVRTSVAIQVRPDNGLTINRSLIACSPAYLTVNGVFAGRGVLLAGDPGVLVAGLGTSGHLLQPAPFAPTIPWPCLLLPSPDVTLFFAGNQPIGLPASMRPITFHVQTVAVDPLVGLVTTDAFTVQAN